MIARKLGFITASVVLVAVFSSAAAYGESRKRCLGFYGVPNDPKGEYNYSAVDHCWGGAHVTLAGF